MTPLYMATSEVAARRFPPYSLKSGTEQLGPLLYMFARFQRAEVIVEHGAGYSTFCLLAALADNVACFRAEREALVQKSASFDPPSHPEESWPGTTEFRTWLGAGDRATHVDPRYYADSDFAPQLISIEKSASDSDYVHDLQETAADCGLQELFSLVTACVPSGLGDASIVPPEIDLAWNDDGEYEEFSEIFWPRLRPGGLLIFHNTHGRRKWHDAVQTVLTNETISAEADVLSLQEPHKLGQNSCTILRKRSNNLFPIKDGAGIVRALGTIRGDNAATSHDTP